MDWRQWDLDGWRRQQRQLESGGRTGHRRRGHLQHGRQCHARLREHNPSAHDVGRDGSCHEWIRPHGRWTCATRRHGDVSFYRGPGSAIIADSVTINSGGQIRLIGLLNISEENGDGLLDLNAGGTISGSGTIHLGDFVSPGTTLLTNDGTISAFAPAPFLGAAPPIRSLAINISDVADALIDLDGSSGNAILNVFRNQTLDVNVRLTDQFSGDINLFQNSVLDMSTEWILDSGTIDVDNGLVDNPPPTPDIPGGVAHIRGGELTQTGGTITVVDADGILEFDAAFHMDGGNLVNNGLVVFRVNADVGLPPPISRCQPAPPASRCCPVFR